MMLIVGHSVLDKRLTEEQWFRYEIYRGAVF